jgi:hypothetical protein
VVFVYACRPRSADGWMIALPSSWLCEDTMVNRTKRLERFEGDT